LDVLYNGTDAAIQVMEFKPGYKDLEKTFKVFGGSKDIKIFPSSKEEVQNYLDNLLVAMEGDIEDKKEELKKVEDSLVKARQIASGTLMQQLTTPEYIDSSKGIEG
jgi:hypothetical protein